MNVYQRRGAIFFTSLVFLAAVLLACIAAYYTVLNWRGDGGNWLTSLLATVLARQSRISNIVGILLAALPSIIMPACFDNNVRLTKLGRLVGICASVTFVASCGVTIFLIPKQDSPEAMSVAISIMHSTNILAVFSLTYLGMLFGFKLDGNIAHGGLE